MEYIEYERAKFTEEQELWLMERYATNRNNVLRYEFCKKFGILLRADQLRAFAANRGLHKDESVKMQKKKLQRFSFSVYDDPEMLAWLDANKPYAEYIRGLIRADMVKGKVEVP